jgi:cytochrome c oxidase cbb3-type subunit 2
MARLSGGWRGIGLVAITYLYFLIFAQFAFLKRLAALGIAETHLQAVMGAMAFGGILLSLLAPRLTSLASPSLRIRAALLACAAAAFLSRMPLNSAAAVGVALLIGCGLGLLTVTLVTHLRAWLGANPLLDVGIGTGLGYFSCNIPFFFAASAETQAMVAGALCLAGVFLPSDAAPPWRSAPASTGKPAPSFLRALCCFTALVWLDSAAFFIIQNTPGLKAGTWEGTLHLWANGTLHFAAALLSVWILRRRGLSLALSAAFAALAVACLLLLDPSRALPASALYPVGVSLYSVALVAYPSLLGPAASTAERGRQAGWIYAVAGWVGSAMGIGMGQHLGHVPPVFVAAAGLVVLSPWLVGIFRRRKREVAAVAAILLAALGMDRALHAVPPPVSQVERGRLVYASEGCIHCHSQYVRPGTADVTMWGPTKSLAELREHPVVIGNRRQGPDLAEVGTRRSPLWLRAHFENPAEVSHASFMPTYAYLFRDAPSGVARGDDLIAYLESLRGQGIEAHLAAEAAWHLSSTATATAAADPDADAGEKLFASYCATCHAADGATRLRWRNDFRRLPPDLPTGPYLHLSLSDSPERRFDRIARIVKFGLPGTDMPGHEYLPDREIASLSLWLAQTMARPLPNQTALNAFGERP